MDWSHFFTFVTGLLSGYTINTVVNFVQKRSFRFTSQKNNIVLGDMVGGDKKNNSK